MTVYAIVDVGARDLADMEAFGRYAEQTDQLLTKAGAKVIACDAPPTVLDGTWEPRSIAIQEYSDMAAVRQVQRSSGCGSQIHVSQMAISALPTSTKRVAK